MYITHHFAHPETMSRARYWLGRLGFEPSRVEVHTEGSPAISLRGAMSEIAEAELLFNALESADPKGRPGFWDSAQGGPWGASWMEFEDAPDGTPRAATVVGWHPPDLELLNDPSLRAIREALLG